MSVNGKNLDAYKQTEYSSSNPIPQELIDSLYDKINVMLMQELGVDPSGYCPLSLDLCDKTRYEEPNFLKSRHTHLILDPLICPNRLLKTTNVPSDKDFDEAIESLCDETEKMNSMISIAHDKIRFLMRMVKEVNVWRDKWKTLLFICR